MFFVNYLFWTADSCINYYSSHVVTVGRCILIHARVPSQSSLTLCTLPNLVQVTFCGFYCQVPLCCYTCAIREVFHCIISLNREYSLNYKVTERKKCGHFCNDLESVIFACIFAVYCNSLGSTINQYRCNCAKVLLFEISQGYSKGSVAVMSNSCLLVYNFLPSFRSAID